jgi:hypothetical protein
MSDSTPNLAGETNPDTPMLNTAVQRCCAARYRSLEESRAMKLDKYDTMKRAHDAYCEALPDLSGYQNIRDFIACVTHGMISEDIHPIQAPKLLYAAQVAIGALRLEPKEPKRKAA